MARTTIALNDEAYRRLKQAKRKGESFSEVVIRTMRECGNTAGEILDLSERDTPPRFDAAGDAGPQTPEPAMIFDTPFVSHCLRGLAAGEMGCARRFAAARRILPGRTTIITVGKLAVVYPKSWQVLGRLETLDHLPPAPRHCGDRRRVNPIGRLM